MANTLYSNNDENTKDVSMIQPDGKFGGFTDGSSLFKDVDPQPIAAEANKPGEINNLDFVVDNHNAVTDRIIEPGANTLVTRRLLSKDELRQRQAEDEIHEKGNISLVERLRRQFGNTISGKEQDNGDSLTISSVSNPTPIEPNVLPRQSDNQNQVSEVSSAINSNTDWLRERRQNQPVVPSVPETKPIEAALVVPVESDDRKDWLTKERRDLSQGKPVESGVPATEPEKPKDNTESNPVDSIKTDKSSTNADIVTAPITPEEPQESDKEEEKPVFDYIHYSGGNGKQGIDVVRTFDKALSSVKEKKDNVEAHTYNLISDLADTIHDQDANTEFTTKKDETEYKKET